MKQPTRSRRTASLLLILALLVAPVSVLAKKGEKNYNRGLEHEKMERWEQAAQEYALALAQNPSDLEYQLHYRRSLFNASQKFMDQGRALAEQGDYAAAYNAFRQAYGFDPVNELAVAEMNRMLRLQREKEGARTGTRPNNSAGDGGGSGDGAGGATTTPAVFQRPAAPQQPAPTGPLPRSEQLRVINYNGDLEDFVRKMAEELGLNVIFDRDFPKRQVKVNLRDVTAARALDDIFVAQNLFFQKLDRRTILVADQSKRGQYQQLVLKTFYLMNIDPQEARNMIQAALPPNSGRQPLVTPNKATNSITVRDTPENIRLIDELLRTIDKDRAEVVMDVNIYEVSRTNLLQLGNQIGSAASLGNLGGFNPLTILAGKTSTTTDTSGGGGGKGGGTKALADVATTAAALAFGGAFVLPATQLSMFQSKDNSRLLAHTQVHAFDGEQSVTRIGQKVPIQTAQVTPFGTAATNTTGGSTNGVFGGNGYPVIQYQDTGLNLKFTPQVFPNQDVEVKMEIESNDVIGGPTALTPTFSQRTMSGKARIPNGRTVMIASVAQDKQSRGKSGLPLLGLIPVLGRVFSTPTDNSTNADIVITVSPRVLSAPVVTPEDLNVRPSGTLQAPISDTLEAMVRDAEREENLAAARQLPTNPTVEVATAATPNAATQTAATPNAVAAQPTQQVAQNAPAQTTDAAAPAYVPAPKLLAGAGNAFAPGSATDAVAKSPSSAAMIPVVNTEDVPPPAKKETAAPQNAATQNAATQNAPSAKNAPTTQPSIQPLAQAPAVGAPQATQALATNVATEPVQLILMSGQREMKVGERQRLMVFVKTDAPLSLAATTLKFDPRVFAVRSIEKGSLFDGAAKSQSQLTQSVDARGSLLALVAPVAGSPVTGAGVLFFVEIEALAAGETEIGFDAAGLHLMSADGRGVAAKTTPVRLSVKQ